MSKKKTKTIKKTKKTETSKVLKKQPANSYKQALSDIKNLVEQARLDSVRSVNAIMTATYWEIGRRIVQVEQKGKKRAEYGEQLIKKLSRDLTKSCGKGFSYTNFKEVSSILPFLFPNSKRPDGVGPI